VKAPTPRGRPKHALTVWARDFQRTAFAWSCVCGTRFHADLPTLELAQKEGRAHVAAALASPERT
jgi:hypothetical protein